MIPFLGCACLSFACAPFSAPLLFPSPTVRDHTRTSLQPFPGRRSVVVADNASVHDDRFRALVEARGAIVLHLSPYSPDYNPIERAWGQIKKWLQRNNKLAHARPKYAMYCAMSSVSAANMRAYFAAALPKGMRLPPTKAQVFVALQESGVL